MRVDRKSLGKPPEKLTEKELEELRKHFKDVARNHNIIPRQPVRKQRR